MVNKVNSKELYFMDKKTLAEFCFFISCNFTYVLEYLSKRVERCCLFFKGIAKVKLSILSYYHG